MALRTVITGVTAITMDADLGDLKAADILVEGDIITAIEPAGRMKKENESLVQRSNSR